MTSPSLFHRQSLPQSGSGFTLIELIVVIVILGVLAASALPKFINFQSESRVAAITRLKGDIVSAASMVNAKCHLSTQCSGIRYPANYQIDGRAADLVSGYPSARAGQAPDATVRAGHLLEWITIDGFNIVQPDGLTLQFFKPVNGQNLATCLVTYKEAGIGATAPDVTATTSGC